MKQFGDLLKRVLDALFVAKDYIGFTIIVVLAVAYFSREDKQDAEEALRIAQEICRMDRIKTDSIWNVRLIDERKYWQAENRELKIEYLQSLRGFTDTVNIAAKVIKRTVVERDLSSREVNRKVNRNGQELENLKINAERKQ